MTSLTLVTLIAIAYGIGGSRGYGRALALGGATAAGAAVVVGTVAVPTFYAVAMGTVGALAFEILGGRGRRLSSDERRLPPGVPLLLLFLGWSVFVTVVSPELFDGLPVLHPVDRSPLTAGILTTSNIAQMVYLALGVCVVIFLARSPQAGPELIGLVAGLATILSLWRYAHVEMSWPFPEGFFDNSPTMAYVEAAPGGVQRFRGIMSEPAALAGSSLVTVCYTVSRSRQLRRWRKLGALVLAGVAVYLGVISTSASFVVAGGVVAGVAALAFLFGFFGWRRTPVGVTLCVAACLTVVISLWLLPIVANFVESTVNDKVSSSSYGDRTASDSESYRLLVDTFGFGTGLGSNRPSSFFAALLSTTGLLGTLLFAAAIVTLIRRGALVYRYRPVVWALVASLVLKVVSGPDLSDSSGILWISLGLLSHAARMAGDRRLGDPPVDAEDVARLVDGRPWKRRLL